ncbi:hypothetical protein [Fredinandcohnia onubensis]|uniref:hypothetical protein n=1 Tax=Fredinandcohnia onubensis TaxID=1571209 RepID=UPI000C0BEF74|nr:hypothetical protein [Fredinandcohnia onubensis]
MVNEWWVFIISIFDIFAGFCAILENSEIMYGEVLHIIYAQNSFTIFDVFFFIFFTHSYSYIHSGATDFGIQDGN